MEADIVLLNGQVVSMDSQKREYEALAIKQGCIVGLGSTEAIRKTVGKNTQIVNLGGKVVLPGLIDAHQHMLCFGFQLYFVDCDKDSVDDIVKAMKARTATVSDPSAWIIGIGVNENKLKEKRLPTAVDLMDIPNPVFMMRYCFHTAVVNELALSLAGIDNSTPDPAAGEIIKDAHGNVTGVLREKAVDLVKKVMPPYTIEQMTQALSLADHRYVSEGITAVHEAGMGFFSDSIDEFRAFQAMAMDGSLQVRVYGMVLDTFFSAFKNAGVMAGFGNSKLKIGPIKIFSDGTLNGRTAAVSQAYLDPAGARGMMLLTTEELEEKVLRAHQAGYQIAIHAIGDHAVDQVITAYEKALQKYPRPDHRHRIEHCSVTTPEIIERMKRLGIIPVPQPSMLYVSGDVYNRVLKPDVLDGVYPLKTFLDAGIKAAGSSDCPVNPGSPMLGMYTAMTRRTVTGGTVRPEQCISLYEAVQMYTVHAAYASFSENELGTLEIGKLGDVIVLPENFMSFTPEEVKDTKVDTTIIGGQIVYKAD